MTIEMDVALKEKDTNTKTQILDEIQEIDREIVKTTIDLRIERNRLITEAIRIHDIQILEIADSLGVYPSDIGTTNFGEMESIPTGSEGWMNSREVFERYGLQKNRLAKAVRDGKFRAGYQPGRGNIVRTVFKLAGE